MVVLGLKGELGGVMIIAFDEHNGRRLAGRFSSSIGRYGSPWSELEKSALTETGNILGCAYIERAHAADRPRTGSLAAAVHPGLRRQRAPAGPLVQARATTRSSSSARRFTASGKSFAGGCCLFPSGLARGDGNIPPGRALRDLGEKTTSGYRHRRTNVRN